MTSNHRAKKRAKLARAKFLFIVFVFCVAGLFVALGGGPS